MTNNPQQELDQIVAQFLNPMNDLVDSMSSHRKFRGPHASKEQVEAELRRLKRENPKQVKEGTDGARAGAGDGLDHSG